jgi:hypothetical protein
MTDASRKRKFGDGNGGGFQAAEPGDRLKFEFRAASSAVLRRKRMLRIDNRYGNGVLLPTLSTAAAAALSGGNEANYLQTARFEFPRKGFLDPSSVRLFYTFTNTSTSSDLTPLTGPWGIWSTAKLMTHSKSVVLDDVKQYGRHHTMFGWNFLTRAEQFAEAVHWSTGGYGTVSPSPSVVTHGTSVSLSHKLHLSIFTQTKFVPMDVVDLDLEMTLNSKATDYLSADASTFNFSNFYLLFDEIVVDATKIPPMPYISLPITYIHQETYFLPSGGTSQYNLKYVRSFSKLSEVWLSFNKAPAADKTVTAKAFAFHYPGTSTSVNFATSTYNTTNTDPYVVASLSIGNDTIPEDGGYQSIPEQFMQLQKVLQKTTSVDLPAFLKSTGVNARSSYALVWDLRKAPGDPLSSLSTRGDEDIVFRLENLDTSTDMEITVTAFAFGALVCNGNMSDVLL